MAVSYNFDTAYYEQVVEGTTNNHGYRIVIGDKTGTVTDASTELELVSPGMTLEWQGGQDLAKNSIMGSALSFTAILTDDQLDTWEDYMTSLTEGDVFALFFNDHAADAEPYWYGHLLPESVVIRVENERHLMDVTFTDGLGGLRGEEWVDDDDGEPYEGNKTLLYWLHEIIKKLPAHEAYKDYVTNELSQDRLEIIRTIAWPEPNYEDSGQVLYDDRDTKLDHLRVRAATFNKPKKQQNRVRELEAPLEYFNAGDVLEDICKAFGATACLYEGRLVVACRLDIAFYGGGSVLRYDYWVQPSTGAYPGSPGSGANDNPKRAFGQEAISNAEDKFYIKAGATKGFTVPVNRVDLTHEEGGSDWLYANGYFLNPDISYINYDDASQFADSNTSPGGLILLDTNGLRKDIFYDFQAPGASVDDTVTLPFYKYPASATDYMGFPSHAETDLEYQSGENIRLTFGGSAKFFQRNALNLLSANLFKKIHIGATLIVRVRVQFTTTANVGYRLSRTVHTHALTGGSPDFITIDNVATHFDPTNGVFVNSDFEYFRKLYNDIEWIKDDDANYDDDGWFEIIVPHADNENSGEGYGSSIIPLTEEYDGQVSYAPIGTVLQGDNDGPGVILDPSDDNQTFLQYFREDINVQLPYGNAAGTTVLDFEDFYFEMGAQEYQGRTGPRGNGGATGVWEGDIPLWRSAEADGSGGSSRYSGSGVYLTRPDYIHFTGMRVAVGDGSETSDITTKATGGDGYEIVNLGSSRIGSRSSYVNNHVSGTIHAAKKDTNAELDFTVPEELIDKLQWRGHRAGDFTNALPSTDYDSLHRYVCESYLQLFGKSRPVYSLSMMPKDSSHRALTSPLHVFQTTTLSDGGSPRRYLQPLRYSWTLNDGVSGNFIQVKAARDLSTILHDEGRAIKGYGGIIGMPTGVDVIGQVQDSKKVTNFDIDTLVDSDGNTKPDKALKENPQDITLVAKSAISGHEGTYKFTASNLYQAILLNGIQELVDGGYGTEADFSGSTTSIVGDFDNDGEVGSADLLSFLANYGQTIQDATAANFFTLSSVEIVREDSNANLIAVPDHDQGYAVLSWNVSNDIQNNFSGSQTTTLTTNDIKFESGSDAPLSAFPNKVVQIKSTTGFANGVADEQTGVRLATTLPDQAINFRVRARAYNSSDVLVETVLRDVPLRADGAPGDYDFSPALIANPIGLGNFADTTITYFKVDFLVRALTDETTNCQVKLRALRVRLNNDDF